MSGSYDRRPPGGVYAQHGRGGPAGYLEPGAAPPRDEAYAGYDDRLVHAPAAGHGHPEDVWHGGATAPERFDELVAAAPDGTRADFSSAGPIVPAGTVTGGSLTLVIAIMTFLACLTVGAVWLINQSATAWLRDIASEVTVQVEPTEGVDTAKTVAEVEQFLRREPGLASVQAIDVEQSQRLLEPWIGKARALDTLPIPRLIAVTVDQSTAPDLKAIGTRLAARYPSASLDDHRQWQRQIRTVTRSFALGGLAILLLVCAATAAIIISATRSALLSNREIVEVLHLVGATDRFIAREFERRFLLLGIRAGLVGALAAMAVFFAMPWIMQLLGGGSVSLTEFQRLIGAGVLDRVGYGVLSSVVLVIAGICMVTSRLGVYRILRTQS